MFPGSFQWKPNLRRRLDLTKASMTNTCSGLRKMSEDNAFISQIFTGYNIMIEHAEMERRNVGAVLNSLKYYNPKRQFLINTINDDLQSATADIIKLFTYGTHDDIRPDEMCYIKYLDPRDEFVCNCGECTSSVRVSLPDNVINVATFDPPIPEPSIDSAFRQLGWMAIDDPPTLADERLRQMILDRDEPVQDNSISITNHGDIRVRAVQHEGASRSILVPSEGELIMDIPSSVRFSNLISPGGGRVTISIDMQYLRNTMAEIDLYGYLDGGPEETELDYIDDLEDVQVLLNARCFNSVVDIATETDIDNCSCAICLEKIQGGSQTLGLLGVKVKCCNKVFHDTCLRHMLCDVGPPRCPLCRKDLRTLCTDQNCNHGENIAIAIFARPDAVNN